MNNEPKNDHPNANLDKSHPLRDMIEVQPEEIFFDGGPEPYEPSPYDGTYSEM